MTMDYNGSAFNAMNSGSLDPGQALQQLQQSIGGGQPGINAPAPVTPSGGGSNPMGDLSMSNPTVGMAGPYGPGGSPFATPAGIPQGVNPTWLAGPGGQGGNWNWQWSTPQANYGVGIANPWQLSPAERLAMTLGQRPATPMPSGAPNLGLAPGQNPFGPTSYGIDPMTGQPVGRADITMPGSYPVSAGGGFNGAGPAAVNASFNPFAGDNALDYLRSLGGTIPSFLQTLFNGGAVREPGNMSAALNGLGGWAGGVPSPQSFGNLSGSEGDFLQGFFESLLGIPMSDIMGASMQPFQNLRTAPRGKLRPRNYVH